MVFIKKAYTNDRRGCSMPDSLHFLESIKDYPKHVWSRSSARLFVNIHVACSFATLTFTFRLQVHQLLCNEDEPDGTHPRLVGSATQGGIGSDRPHELSASHGTHGRCGNHREGNGTLVVGRVVTRLIKCYLSCGETVILSLP